MRLSLIALLALAGCNQSVNATHPATGRYQMVGSVDGVYVLDTVEGTVNRCFTTMANVTWCTAPVKSSEGTGHVP